MYSIYEVNYNGNTYFGNVVLREIHIFDYKGNSYLFDVDNNRAHLISYRVATMVNKVASMAGGLVPESVMQELRDLNIVSGINENTKQTTPKSILKKTNRHSEYSVTNMSLVIAQECNMRCVYCYGDGGEYGHKGLMSEKTAYRAVDWLIARSKSAQKLKISFFGGEPLLNFALIKKVVPYAKEQAAQMNKEVSFGMSTNASLITDEIISFIQKEKINLLVGFDGVPEYQNIQRPFKHGGRSFDIVHSNIQKLLASFPHLRARATVFGTANPIKIKHGLEKAGFASYSIAKASPIITGARSHSEYLDKWRVPFFYRMRAYNRKEADELLNAIRAKSLKNDETYKILVTMFSGRKRHYTCGIGKSLVAVSIDGYIYPCHRFTGCEETRMGNVNNCREGGINEYHRAVVENRQECRQCWVRYFCGGGCFYNNKARTGDMYRPDPLDCQETKEFYEGLIHVYCHLEEEDKNYLKSMVNVKFRTKQF